MNGVTTDFSGPYEPAHIALIESFNGRCLAECLVTREFLCLDDAVRKCGALRGFYEEVRPIARSGHGTRKALIFAGGTLSAAMTKCWKTTSRLLPKWLAAYKDQNCWPKQSCLGRQRMTDPQLSQALSQR